MPRHRRPPKTNWKLGYACANWGVFQETGLAQKKKLLGWTQSKLRTQKLVETESGEAKVYRLHDKRQYVSKWGFLMTEKKLFPKWCERSDKPLGQIKFSKDDPKSLEHLLITPEEHSIIVKHIEHRQAQVSEARIKRRRRKYSAAKERAKESAHIYSQLRARANNLRTCAYNVNMCMGVLERKFIIFFKRREEELGFIERYLYSRGVMGCSHPIDMCR